MPHTLELCLVRFDRRNCLKHYLNCYLLSLFMISVQWSLWRPCKTLDRDRNLKTLIRTSESRSEFSVSRTKFWSRDLNSIEEFRSRFQRFWSRTRLPTEFSFLIKNSFRHNHPKQPLYWSTRKRNYVSRINLLFTHPKTKTFIIIFHIDLLVKFKHCNRN